MKKIFLFLLCVILSQNANALCRKHPIRIHITTQPGQVVYDHAHSKTEFSQLTNMPVNPNTLGLTVSALQLSMKGKPHVERDGKQFCVGIQEINFSIGYDKIKVYIDKKYPKNSCNYRVIKDHEDYHVGVSQEAMKFFRPDLERELRKAVDSLQPESAYSETRAQQIMNKQFALIQQRMQPLLNHINSKISEKNYAIDTPESYMETTKLCPKW